MTHTVFHMILADTLVDDDVITLCGRKLKFSRDMTIKDDWLTPEEYFKDLEDPMNCKLCQSAITPLLHLKHTNLGEI